MSKFQSVISTVAALASIFAAGAAGYKLAQSQPDYKPQDPQPTIEQKLTQLEQKLDQKLSTPLQMPSQQAPAPSTLPHTPQASPAPPEPVQQPTEASPWKSMKPEVTARIISSVLVVTAYYITMYHDTVTGAKIYMVANSLALPYMIRNKCWDIVLLLSFLIIVGLPKVLTATWKPAKLSSHNNGEAWNTTKCISWSMVKPSP